MKRVIFFVDGFNLYHSLVACQKDDSTHTCSKWFDLTAFLTQFHNPATETIDDIYYFSAFLPWSTTAQPLVSDSSKAARHRRYRSALEHFGVKTVFGEFRKKRIFVPTCNSTHELVEEKKTDVSIGVTIVKLAAMDAFDTAILVSGDTDFVPAVQAVKELAPQKKIGVLFPYKRANKEMQKYADFTMKAALKHYRGHVLPLTIALADGTQIVCPHTWT